MTRMEPDWKTIEIFIQEHPDGGDFQEIADVFRCQPSTVQQVLARAIRKIFTICRAPGLGHDRRNLI